MERDTLCASRAEALSAVRLVAASAVAYHNRFLGKGVAEIVREATQQGLFSFRGAVSGLLPPLAGARVRLTIPGVAGDCGSDSGALRIRHAPNMNKDWRQHGAHFASLLRSREVVRSTSALTLTRPQPVLGLTLGIDASTLLPPCPPVGRGQDAVFFALLHKCIPDAFSCHLPRVVRHVPPIRAPYSYSSFSEDIRSFRLADVVLALVFDAPVGLHSCVEERFTSVGAFLRDASASIDNFNDMWGPLVTRERASHIHALSRLLALHCDGDPTWRTLAEAQIRTLESCLYEPTLTGLRDPQTY